MARSILTNLTLSVGPVLSSFGVRSRGKERAAAESSVAQLSIKVSDLGIGVGSLSGGNQQKVVFGKNLLRDPEILLLDDPTRGVDIGAKSEIYLLLDTLSAAGMSVLVASSEIPELIGLCDRIAVLRDGEIVTILDHAEADEEKILALAARLGADDEHRGPARPPEKTPPEESP